MLTLKIIIACIYRIYEQIIEVVFIPTKLAVIDIDLLLYTIYFTINVFVK